MVQTLLSTSLFGWKLAATDVSRMAGHANYRITPDMYVRHHRRHPRPRPPGDSVTTPGRERRRAGAGMPARRLLAITEDQHVSFRDPERARSLGQEHCESDRGYQLRGMLVLEDARGAVT
jgi:hypothetical protein